MATTLLPGSTKRITWKDCLLSNTIYLGYCLDGESGPWIPIDPAAPAHNDATAEEPFNGHFDWTVPAGTFTNLYIKKQDTGNAAVFVTEGPFTYKRQSVGSKNSSSTSAASPFL